MAKDSGNIYGPQGGSLAGANQNYDALGGQNFAALNGAAPLTAAKTQSLLTQDQQNPYMGPAQVGVNAAASYGANTLTPQLQQGATTLAGVGNQNAGYVPQALQTGFDPQNGLYNRNFQQNQDQQAAISAMSGVSGTPYAAGVAGDAARNFNLDWQDRQLGRQQTAAGTAGTLTNNANSAFTGASNVGNSALNTGTASALLPSQTYNTNIMDQIKALIGGNTAIGGATQNNDAAMSQILQYLGYGTDATGAQQKESDKTQDQLGQAAGLAALAFL